MKRSRREIRQKPKGTRLCNLRRVEVWKLFSFEPSRRKLKSKKKKEGNEGSEKGDGVTQEKKNQKNPTLEENPEKQRNGKKAEKA